MESCTTSLKVYQWVEVYRSGMEGSRFRAKREISKKNRHYEMGGLI